MFHFNQDDINYYEQLLNTVSTAAKYQLLARLLDTLKYLQSEGAEITMLPVDSDGVVVLKALEKAIKKETTLISVMFANNEIGSIQPIKEIGAFAKSKGIIFHTDAGA